jgi:hypothetical protein
MTSVRFACPHCSGQFSLDDPPAGQAVGCPHCGRSVGIPQSPQQVETSAAVQSVSERDETAIGGDALDFLNEAVSVPRRGRKASLPSDGVPLPEIRLLGRIEQRRRQQRRSVVVMILCMAVLAVALMLLNKVSRSH